MLIDLPSSQRQIKLFIQHKGTTSRRNGHLIDHYTSAEIQDLNGNTIHRTTACCSVFDQFQKKIGVRIAVTRLLEKMKLDKIDRTAIWTRVWNIGVKSKINFIQAKRKIERAMSHGDAFYPFDPAELGAKVPDQLIADGFSLTRMTDLNHVDPDGSPAKSFRFYKT